MVTGSTAAESMVPEPKVEDDKEEMSVIFVGADATVTRLIQCQRRTQREVELDGRLGQGLTRDGVYIETVRSTGAIRTLQSNSATDTGCRVSTWFADICGWQHINSSRFG